MVDAKRAALLALVVQNTLLVLTMRYSRTRPGPMYLASTAVVVDEALKATVCVAALLWQWSRSEQRGGAAAFLRREVCERPAETMKMAVVAGLYTLQLLAALLASIWGAEGPRARALMLLHQQSVELGAVRAVLDEYATSVGETAKEEGADADGAAAKEKREGAAAEAESIRALASFLVVGD